MRWMAAAGLGLVVALALGGPAQAQTAQAQTAQTKDDPPAAAGKAGPAADAGPQDLGTCPDDMTVFAGETALLRCACPAGAAAAGSVWGTDIYSADSATCRAGLHAGLVGRNGGTLTIRMLPGQPRYPGTTRNGVQSQNFGAYANSYRFEGAAAPAAAAPDPAGPTRMAQCPDDMTAFAHSDEVLICGCSALAVAQMTTAWGSDIYTADSNTCRAALHAGALGRQGGEVTLRMLPGQPRYPGTTRNGVQTQSYGPYDSSFRFENTRQAAAPVQVPVQAPVAESLRQTGQVALYVTFRTGSADLDIAAAPVLGQVRDALLADPALRLRLIGHTDTTGSAQSNLPLSVRRAEAVRAWLAQNGVVPDRLVAEGRGQGEPVADNGTEAGRALNRRVQAVRVP